VKIWCLHGAVGMTADWDEFAERMCAAGQEVCMVDLWGFVEEGACSFADFAAELNARVRAEEEAPVLLGYSMGGRLALHALLEDGVPWRAGVIVSAHPGIRDPEERVMRVAKDAEWATGAFSGSWQKFLADWNSQGVLEGEMVGRLGDRNRLEPRRVAVARGFMEWSLGKQEDLGPRLGEIECPVLWLTGERDARFSALAEEAIPLISNGLHRVMSGAGHRVPWDAAEEFAQLVHEFVANVKAP